MVQLPSYQSTLVFIEISRIWSPGEFWRAQQPLEGLSEIKQCWSCSNLSWGYNWITLMIRGGRHIKIPLPFESLICAAHGSGNPIVFTHSKVVIWQALPKGKHSWYSRTLALGCQPGWYLSQFFLQAIYLFNEFCCCIQKMTHLFPFTYHQNQTVS